MVFKLGENVEIFWAGSSGYGHFYPGKICNVYKWLWRGVWWLWQWMEIECSPSIRSKTKKKVSRNQQFRQRRFWEPDTVTNSSFTVNKNELSKFLGATKYMSLIKLPQIYHHWSGMTRQPIIADNISRNRWKEIKSNLFCWTSAMAIRYA